MPKLLTSPSAHFHGTITISSPLTFPQFLQWQEALEEAGKHENPYRRIYALMPAIIATVEKWDVTGIPSGVSPETFPATPAADMMELCGFIITEIMKEVRGLQDLPNASRAEPTPTQ